MNKIGFVPCLLHLVWILVNVLPHITGNTRYCTSEVQNIQASVGGEGGKIITRRSGENNYRNNEQCVWVIDSGDVHNRIQIYVERTDVEWAPEVARCSNYDFVEIRAGDDAQSPRIISWCRDTPPFSVITNTSTAYIKFESNDRNRRSESGVIMNYTVFDMRPPDGSCPPGWRSRDSSDSPSCYKFYDTSLAFEDAQKVCRHQYSNLVSFVDDEEVEFVLDYVRDSLGDFEEVWIGLTDIQIDGEYLWLDGSPNTIEGRFMHPGSSNQYYNCIKMIIGSGRWDEDMCDAQVQSLIKHQFVCKRNKTGTTEVFVIPTQRNEKGEEGTLPPKKFIIGGLVAGALVLIIAVVAIYWIRVKRQESEEKREHPDDDVAAPESASPFIDAAGNPQPPPPTISVEPSAPYDPDIHPPPYEEVIRQK